MPNSHNTTTNLPSHHLPPGITSLLVSWHQGDSRAAEELMPLVYERLRKLAHRRMQNEPRRRQIQTTDLLHEAYLRLDGLNIAWESRGHFFGMTARMMRNVLVDMARQSRALKRGGDEVHLTLLENDLAMSRSAELLSLDDALTDLATRDPRKAKILELRYFAGMTNQEIADFLKLSVSTVERDQRIARAWLSMMLAEDDDDEDEDDSTEN